MRKIGILGGTFNPIHIGHLQMAKAAHEEMGCEEVWFMPAGIPPHKQNKPILKASDRIEMIELAIADLPYAKLFDYEITKTTPCYTAQTMSELNLQYPKDKLYFIIGADSLVDLPLWKDPLRLFQETNFLVFPRGGVLAPIDKLIAQYQIEFHASIVRATTQVPSISSTQIREDIYKNALDHAKAFLPVSVLTYIEAHALYQNQ